MKKVYKADLCKKCGESHDLEKACSPKKGNKLEKLMAPTSNVPGSVATTGGPSIASQIGFGKSEDKSKNKEEERRERDEYNANRFQVIPNDGSKYERKIKLPKKDVHAKEEERLKQLDDAAKKQGKETIDERTERARAFIGMKKADNPDKEADAELGEQIEEAVEEHMKENEEDEKKEGHKIRFEKGMSYKDMKKKEDALDQHMKELEKAKVDEGKSLEDKVRSRQVRNDREVKQTKTPSGQDTRTARTSYKRMKELEVGHAEYDKFDDQGRPQRVRGIPAERRQGEKIVGTPRTMQNETQMPGKTSEEAYGVHMHSGSMAGKRLPVGGGKDSSAPVSADKEGKSYRVGGAYGDTKMSATLRHGQVMRGMKAIEPKLAKAELIPGMSYNDLKKTSEGYGKDEEEDARQAAEEYSEKVAKPHSKAKQQAKDLKDMKEKSAELEKAKVDEGKSKDEKVKAREERNVRNFASKKPNAPRGSSNLGVNAPSSSGKKGESIVGDYIRGSKPTGPLSGEHSDSRTKSDLMNQAKKMVSFKINETKNSPKVNLGKSELKPGMSYQDLRKTEAELEKAEAETDNLADTIRKALAEVRAKLKN